MRGNTGSIARAPRDFPDTLPAEERARLLDWLEAQLAGPLAWLRDEGFELREAHWPTLHLESPRARLNLSFAAAHWPALRLGATLGERGDRRLHSLGEAQRLLGHPEHGSRELVMDDADTALARLDELLRELRPLLAGDPDAYATLRRRDSELLAETQLDEDLRTALPEARDAFDAQDYARVVALLDPLEGHLPAADRRRLDLARGRL